MGCSGTVGLWADCGPGSPSHRSFADPGSQDRVGVARRLLRSGNAIVDRGAFPIVASGDGAAGAGRLGLFLGTPAGSRPGGFAIHGASSGGCNRVLGAALVAAFAAGRSGAVPFTSWHGCSIIARTMRRCGAHGSSYT